MILDPEHATNRRVSIPGRNFTSSDVGRLLYVPTYDSVHYVRTGTYHITSVSGNSAVLDRIVGLNGTTNVWWEVGGGWVLRSTTGTSDSYTITATPERGDHVYVRLFCVQDQNRQVWSQPFFVK